MEMEFASALYSTVTSRFFNYLCTSVDDQFSARCAEITGQGLYADEFKVIEQEVIDTFTKDAGVRPDYRDGGLPTEQVRRLDDEEEDIWNFQTSREEYRRHTGVSQSESGSLSIKWQSKFMTHINQLQSKDPSFLKDLNLAKLKTIFDEGKSR